MTEIAQPVILQLDSINISNAETKTYEYTRTYMTKNGPKTCKDVHKYKYTPKPKEDQKTRGRPKKSNDQRILELQAQLAQLQSGQ